MKTILMHTCCAPCSLSCIDPLRAEGIEPVAFWYNPNIHPWKEYEARRDCLLTYAPTIGMRVIVDEEYGLRTFVEHVADDIDHRCIYCYRHRLEETARFAAEHGYMVKKRLLEAGLDASQYSSHKLRHTAATLMLQNGVDVRAVQEVLGHDHLNTTEIYTHIDNEALRVAAKANPLSHIQELDKKRQKEQ